MTDHNLVDLLADRPVHQHNCKVCLWLGTVGFDGPLSDGTTYRVQADLYCCTADRKDPTVLSRYGDGSRYSSTLSSLIRRDFQRMQDQPATHTPGLLEAYRRAVERGLV